MIKKYKKQIAGTVVFITTIILFVSFRGGFSAKSNPSKDMSNASSELGNNEQGAEHYIDLYPWIEEPYQEKMHQLTGGKASNFQMKNLEGEEFEFHDYLGEDIVLAFIASWCGPCNEMLSIFSDFNQSGSSANVLMVTAFDEEEDFRQYATASRAMGVELYQAIDFNQDDYLVNSVPQMNFINEDGIIQVIDGGYKELDMLVDYAKTSFN